MIVPLLFFFAAPPSVEDVETALKRFSQVLAIVEEILTLIPATSRWLFPAAHVENR